MAETGILGRKPFWAGLFAILLGAVGLLLGITLDLGRWRAPGPGALPVALSLAALLWGLVAITRVAARPDMPDDAARRTAFWRSPPAIIAAAVALAAAALALLRPLTPTFTGYGPATLFAWYTLVLALGVLAASLAAGGAPMQALGGVVIGLLLGMSGIDPLVTSVQRYASTDLGIWLNFVHGLVLAMVAYHIGLNALLMALATALATTMEKALRETLMGGGLSTFFDQPIGLALLGASVVAIAAAIWLRPSAAWSPAAPDATPPVFARPAFWAGAVAIVGGAAGLYFAPAKTGGDPGRIGPEMAPLLLSAALAVLGLVILGSAMLRPASPGAPARRALARSPATIGSIVLLAILAVVYIGAPVYSLTIGPILTEFALRMGPPEFATLILLLVTLCIAAAWLFPRGSLLRALGSVVIGLLLGTLGIDTITGVTRYVLEVDWLAAHGLAIGYIGYRIGFNPLLIAVGFVYSPMLEERARQSLLLSQGDLSVFAERSTNVSLLLAAAAVLMLGALLRWWQWRKLAGVGEPAR